MGRICVVILLGFCLGLLSGCDQGAIQDLQKDQVDHAFSLGKAWDEIKQTTKKADCAYDNGTVLAAKLQKLEQQNKELRTTLTLTLKDYDKTLTEWREVIEHHEKAIEELGNMVASATPPPAPVQAAPAVVINHADSKPLKVTPIRCPTGKCPKR